MHIYNKIAPCNGIWGTAAGHGDGDQNTIIVSQIFLDTDPVLYGAVPECEASLAASSCHSVSLHVSVLYNFLAPSRQTSTPCIVRGDIIYLSAATPQPFCLLGKSTERSVFM